MNFPKLKIGETGTFADQTITRISPKLYTMAGSCLRYQKNALISIFTGPYSAKSPQEAEKRIERDG